MFHVPIFHIQRYLTFSEMHTHHESLDHDTSDTLKAHNKYSFGAFFGSRTTAISNGVLGFDTEEETTSETENVIHTWRPVILHLIRWQMTFFEVTVGEGY